MKCPTFQSFSNGNINMTVVGGRTEAMFTCDSGCSLNGQSSLTCQSDGTWDFQTPNCGELQVCLDRNLFSIQKKLSKISRHKNSKFGMTLFHF